MDKLSRRTLLGLFSAALANRAVSEVVGQSVRFTDVAIAAGLGAARNVSGLAQNKRFLLEEMGGGVALFDYDNDGWLDIFLVNGTSFESAGGKKATSFLFRNNRDGTFTNVTEKARLTQVGWGQGCCVGDYDNDGFDDLFVSYWGRNVLYHNNGDGTFTDVTEKAGLAGNGQRWGAGCCFVDYDRDGRLDLFCAEYVNFDPAQTPKPGEAMYCRYNSIAVPCGPQGFSGGSNRLYRNRGDGTFENVSEKSGVANPRGRAAATFTKANWRPVGAYGMGAVAADFDNDGWPDIYVASDTAPSLLYRNNHDGTFREIATEAGCAFDENGVALSGMGVAIGDVDGDGWLDLARTNFSDQVTTIYRNNGDGTFRDASLESGLGVNRKYLGFGTGLFDFDNDGWEDLFVANGHVYSQLAGRSLYLSYKQPKLLYKNLGNGKFEDISAVSGPGILTSYVSRGCAFGDLDNDGDIDIVVNNLDSPPSLLRNDGGNRNNWLIVKCIGTRSNRSGIGTRLRLTAGGRTQIREVVSGSSYYSHNDLRVHFGLGAATRIDRLELQWPSSLKEVYNDVEVNKLVKIIEGTRSA
jgi:enediyne biosynthesis protein E4